ncbi:hypothetical protein MTR67_018536 [Solanum verrucosum]|uniref:Uncharacterized protein n=1 Tax=Solanum verrucosum TaxID=315347 RepID=A0AAF0QQZ3_SOLVR|nr:hypothetical protein MTR67_018536 [Solanum verrucosum]
MVPNLLEIGFLTVRLVGQGGTSCIEEIGAGDGAKAGILGMILKSMESPSGRKDVAIMRTQMLRKAPRIISPRRCTGEDGFAYVGVRHSEKFNREFPADNSSPVYSHQQSMYDGPDSHFAQGDTEFTAIQRSGFPRM